jgi:nucleotide-binding universal stress UspA family protein
MSTPTSTATTSLAEAVFSRVVAGVDGGEPGYEAVRQASRLVAPEGSLELFTAVHFADAALAGWSSTRLADELRAEADETVRRAAELAGPRAGTKLVNGPPPASFLQEVEEQDATLAVVGTHGHKRVAEIVLGGVAGQLLHEAPCSVCIARRPGAGSVAGEAVDARPSDRVASGVPGAEALFPRAIVAGCDGSPQSEAAVGVARYLAERFDVPLELVTALGGKDVDRERAHELGVTFVQGHPVKALVDAGRRADLLVVGSRGLHGLKALGSVSERAAHRATCSVLVVRGRV